jgi:hypothetical protein
MRPASEPSTAAGFLDLGVDRFLEVGDRDALPAADLRIADQNADLVVWILHTAADAAPSSRSSDNANAGMSG